ncbi:uncharacterized protein P884DRAFT_102758 [Thermothelomyces heterothallicus CBS 202.75]|uniref:uncharacterized protein n=1 Tax=Thermothelomyces heterothallicus CBS 202.75 TaxID=1149848 RepID=UPI00374226FB
MGSPGSPPCPPFFVALLEPRVASPAAGASPAPLSPSSAFLVARRWRFLRFALFIGYSFWPSLILPRAVAISLALARDTEVVLPLLYPAKSPPFARAADLARLPGIAYVQCRRTGRPPLAWRIVEHVSTPTSPPKSSARIGSPNSLERRRTLCLAALPTPRRVHAAPPPASGLNHSGSPIATTLLRPTIVAKTTTRRVTQNAIIRRFQTAEESRMRMVPSWRRKLRTIRAATISSWLMPSHAPGPRVHTAPDPIVGLKLGRGRIAAASLSSMITMTAAVRRATQNNVILWCRATEKSRIKRARPWCRRKHRRPWLTYRGCPTMGTTTVSWPMPSRLPSHPYSHPPANLGLTFSVFSVVVDIAIPMIGRTIILR